MITVTTNEKGQIVITADKEIIQEVSNTLYNACVDLSEDLEFPEKAAVFMNIVDKELRNLDK